MTNTDIIKKEKTDKISGHQQFQCMAYILFLLHPLFLFAWELIFDKKHKHYLRSD